MFSMLLCGIFFHMEEKNKTIYTIGHSTHAIEHFIGILKSFDIKLLADIRTFPGSRRYPHFNKESLAESLTESGIQYLHYPDLGGRRKPKPDSVNTAWRSAAFQGYADHMQSLEFIKAAGDLQLMAISIRTAYMCSEAVWWRCHRALLSDYLKVREWTVLHIMDIAKQTEHPYTSAASVKQGKLFY